MERVIRQTVKATTLLEDAKPVFVSLVKHGANQTPFRTIKSDDPAPAMSKPATTVKKGLNLEAGVEINRIIFKGEQFKDSDAIKKYLDEAGFTNYDIDQKGADFEVPGIDISEFAAEPTVVKADEGVEYYVGKLKGEAETAAKTGEGTSPNTATPAPAPAATAKTEGAQATTPEARTRETPAAPATQKTEDKPVFLKTTKGESLLKKWDYCASYYSNGKTLGDVMKDAQADGIPLGYHEVMGSFTKAVSNSLKDNDVPAIKGLVSELGEYLTKLAELTAEVANKSEKEEWMATFAQTEQTPATTTAKSAEQGADTTAKTLEDMEKRLKALEDKEAETAKKFDGVGTRVAKLERVRQTRKSADVGDLAPESPATEPANTDTKTDISKLSKSEKNLLGYR